MYNPAPFAEVRQEVLHDFIRSHPLAALVTWSETEGLTATHVPMLLEAQEGSSGLLRCHVARANPQWHGLSEAMVIFSGADHYVSPSWYPSRQEHGRVVPTWNYTAVHVWGRARIFESGADLIPFLRRLTDEQESAFAKPWSIDDAPHGYMEGLARSIVGVEIAIDRIQGKWKLSQNRSEPDQEGVIDGLDALGTKQSLETAEAMKRRRS